MNINPYEAPESDELSRHSSLSRWRFIPTVVCGFIGFLLLIPILLLATGLLVMTDKNGDPQPEAFRQSITFFLCYFVIGLVFLFAAWSYFVGRYRWGIMSNLAVFLFFLGLFLFGQ